jgi:hypothetical protein
MKDQYQFSFTQHFTWVCGNLGASQKSCTQQHNDVAPCRESSSIESKVQVWRPEGGQHKVVESGRRVSEWSTAGIDGKEVHFNDLVTVTVAVTVTVKVTVTVTATVTVM